MAEHVVSQAVAGDITPIRPRYSGKVPPLASHRPRKDYYARYKDKIYCARHIDGAGILVFPSTYAGEHSDGTAVFEQIQSDEDNPMDRIQTMRAIYEHLSSGPDHRRIVQYLGSTPSGFMVEKLTPGPFPTTWPALSANSSDTNKTVTALCQRWALQTLSAIAHLHAHNIVLNQLTPEMLWLREDFSIALAIPHAAGCVEPPIRGETGWTHDWQIMSQWHLYSQHRLYTDGPRWLDDEKCSATQLAGDPKGDLFEWATLMYRLLVPGDSPIEQALYERAHQPFDMTLFHKEVRRRLSQISRGRNRSRFWPDLPDEMLGSVLKKCWLGKYSTSQDALDDARVSLEKLGVTIRDDEIEGYKWQDELEVIGLDITNESYELRLRRHGATLEKAE